ncbi:MAG: general secretion pathway protein GspB [Burkholderiaceae bacterium]|nr:general secretion pathway protein GspB [Burkholderiaceae bacterium]
MSLILDALRKAEAERQRGTVPGLHSVAAGSPAAPPAAAAGRRGGVLAAGLAALVLAAGALWAALGREQAPAAGRPDARLPAPAPAAPPAPTPAPTPPLAAATPPPLPVVVSVPPVVPSREPPAQPPAPPAEPARPPGAPIITQVRRLAELPAEQRRELPPLVVGGSVWSDQASARFVVLDGQVLREGDAAAPGLVLVKLAPRAATLRWRDMLLELPL